MGYKDIPSRSFANRYPINMVGLQEGFESGRGVHLREGGNRLQRQTAMS